MIGSILSGASWNICYIIKFLWGNNIQFIMDK